MGSTKGALVVTLVCWASGAAADQPEDRPLEDESTLVKRVTATLIGEAIGGGLPLAIGYGLIDSTSCNRFSGCSSFPFSIGATIAPITFTAGGGGAHAIFGGKAGPGFGLLGGLAGYVVGLNFLAFVSLAANKEWSAKAPAAGAGLLIGLTLAGGVIGLELRHHALLIGARPWSVLRLSLTTLAFWVPAVGLSLGLGYAIAELSRSSPVIVAPGIILGGLSVAVLSGLACWGVHKLLGGKGNGLYIIGGLLGSTAVAALFFFSHFWSRPTPRLFNGSDGTEFIAIGSITGALLAAGPAVALEWNGSLQEPDRDEPKAPPLSLGISPAPGGAVLGIGVRF